MQREGEKFRQELDVPNLERKRGQMNKSLYMQREYNRRQTQSPK